MELEHMVGMQPVLFHRYNVDENDEEEVRFGLSLPLSLCLCLFLIHVVPTATYLTALFAHCLCLSWLHLCGCGNLRPQCAASNIWTFFMAPVCQRSR